MSDAEEHPANGLERWSDFQGKFLSLISFLKTEVWSCAKNQGGKSMYVEPKTGVGRSGVEYSLLYFLKKLEESQQKPLGVGFA